ncbi:MAG: hypothetical protein KBA87_05960 [Lachnospiraceae bacterium]|jgi:hypothetical protein|nr:hypothetical protein [Lachnospiraceae bacterium]
MIKKFASNLRKSAFIMILLFTMFITTGCGKLSERKFDMALRGTGMKSVVQTTEKEGIYPGIKFWKYAGSSTKNKLQLQYIVFKSEKDAETFADSQKQYISTNIGGGSDNNGYYTAEAQNFFYYIGRVKDKVIIGDSPSDQKDLLISVLKKMPDVPID